MNEIINCRHCGCQIDGRVKLATFHRDDWGWIQQQLERFPRDVWDSIIRVYRERYVNYRRQAFKLGRREHQVDSFARSCCNQWLLDLDFKPSGSVLVGSEEAGEVAA